MINKFSIVLILLTFSCSEKQRIKIEEEVLGDWVVEQVVYDGKSYREEFFLYNMFTIEKNGLCRVPRMIGFIDRNASWSIDTPDKGKDYYIKIENCQNDFFNTNFQITLLGEIDNLMKIKLTSEDLELYCAKVIFK